jgi:S-adenosylmethionine:tRNA ribosyltransferase-isomerase
MDALDFDLPAERVATRPAEPRESAKLLVCSRRDPAMRIDARVADLPEHFRPGDLAVFNRTAVLPARLMGRRADTSGRIEGLYLDTVPAETATDQAGVPLAGPFWRCLLKSNGALRPGAVLVLHDAADQPSNVTLRLIQREAEGWLAQPCDTAGRALDAPAATLLHAVGHTPLPPYIVRSRREHGQSIDDAQDRAWYQTVYADPGAAGSVAAPTAGLHFTPALLDTLTSRGVASASVVLHVGEGTFRPVVAERLHEHPMHAEWISVPAATVRAIAETRARGGRCVAVGTTTCRALESLPASTAGAAAHARDDYTGLTRLLLAPGDRFAWVDGLLTNFHLPRSTLLALVAAMLEDPGTPGSGLARVHALYQHAIAHGYRFFSYGDAMLILP